MEKYEGSTPTSVMSVPWSVVMNGQAADGREHLLGQHGGDGVRDGVVHVQQVELVALGDFGHARGEREAVGRVLEERVVGDFDLVIVDARGIGIEADRIGVGDEVDLVAAGGQFQAEFGGDDAAAAVGGIAGDADVHFTRVAKPICPWRFSSGDATSPPPNQTRMRSPVHDDGGVADHFGVPGLRAGEDGGELRPVDAIGGARQAEAAVLLDVAAGVEHPVESVRLPDGGLAEAGLVEGAGAAQFEDGIGAQLLPVNAVGGARHAEALADGAILAEIVQVEVRLDADHVGIGDDALVPGSDGAVVEHGRRLLAPGLAVGRAREADAVLAAGRGLIPIPELAAVESRLPLAAM